MKTIKFFALRIGFVLPIIVTSSFALADPVPALVYKSSSSLCIASIPTLGDDGRFYAVTITSCNPYSGPAGVAAFNPSDGSIAWGPIIPPGCSSFPGGRISAGSNGKLYAIGDANECGDGRLVAFNASDGSIAWDHGECPGSPHPRQTPALNEVLNSVYFGSSSLCSVDMDSGVNNWAVGGGFYIGARGIAIDSSGNISYGTHAGGVGNGKIRSYTSGGTFRWERSFSGTQNTLLALIDGMTSADKLLIYTETSNSLMAWDSNGNDTWQANNLSRSVTDEVGNIYANSVTGADVVALNADGSERWRRALLGATWAMMDFVDDTGHVYVRGNNVLYALNTVDGSIAWSFAADAALEVGAVLAPGGRIFLSDKTSNLYLLDTCLEYAASAWPIAEYGNRRHTEKAGDILPLPSQCTLGFNFTGFFQPVDNLPVLNQVNAGRAIPVKFSLGGDQGLNIFTAGYPKSEQILCESTALVDGIEQTVTAGSSSLSYDPSTDQYNYVWKTEMIWANTCRQLVVKLNDNSIHRANFKFK